MSGCSNKWPTLLDFGRDDSKRMLRSLELDAYATMVTAFRAQGDLNKDKRKLLQDLQAALSISTERHRAEIRRATNDEKLTTIADHMAGPDVSSEWQVEGRRLIPLMPRLVPQTAFTVAANNAANVQAEKNYLLPSPSLTPSVDVSIPNAESVPNTPVSTKVNRPSSPTSSVVVLPSGMSIHIKGGLNTEEEDIHGKTRRQRRSSSAESLVMTRTTPIITTVTSASKIPAAAAASASNSIQGITPMKISVTKSPVKSHTTTVTPAQKVIIVSSSASATAGSNIVHKSVHIPIVKTGVTTTVSSSTASHPRPSIVVPSSSTVSLGPPQHVSHTVTTGSSYVTTPRPRVKHITTRHKTPQQMSRSGIMLPVGAQSIQTGSPTMQNIQIKPVNKPTIHIKQEGSMKIITQGMPGGTSKILPKPSGGAPVVVVTTVPSSSQLAKSISTSGPAGKVLNFSTAGGRLIATTRGTTANVVTVNPKTLQLTTVRGASGTTVLTGSRIATPTGAKPNVIVVQKAQPKRAQTPTTPTTIHISKSSASSSPFEKELVSFIQKQDTHQKTPGQPQKFSIQKGTQKQTVELTKRPIVVRQQPGVDVVHKTINTPGVTATTSAGVKGSSLLAELIQAVGIGPENVQVTQGEEIILSEESCAIASISDTQKDAGQNQWVEYDVETGPEQIVTEVTTTTTPHTINEQVVADHTDVSAIKALLDLQSNSQAKTNRPSTLEITEESTEGQPGFLTLEQVQNMIANQTVTVQPVDAAPMAMEEVQPSTSGIEIQAPEITPVEISVQGEIGELDPQTGLFYTSGNSTAVTTVATEVTVAEPRVETVVVTQAAPAVTINENVVNVVKVTKEETTNGTRIAEPVVSVSAEYVESAKNELEPKQLDFLSSALNQAQIDLNPYNFIEEDEPAPFSTKLPNQNQTVTVSEPVTSESQGPLVSILTPQPSISNTVTFNSLSTTSAVKESQNIVVTAGTNQDSVVDEEPTFLQTDPLVSAPDTPGISSQIVTTPSPIATQSKFIPIQDVLLKKANMKQNTASNVTVTVEPTGATGLDTTHMKIEDFTSQRYTEQSEGEMGNDDTSPFGSPSSTSAIPSLSDSHDSQSMRLSKRKRKPPPTPDEITMQSSVGGWVRLALGLLQRVCRFRGSYKEKGEMNAASWFTRPVDPSEVPDYYTIIISPMDFGTIKRKLEAAQYHDWEDFHADMVLVRDNCLQYNPIGTDVRRDCEEVFQFYLQEYDKALVKWQQTHVATSPSGKKIKLATSPVRSSLP